NIVLLQRSLMLNFYQEGKCRRTESDKQVERLHDELNKSYEQIEKYRQSIYLLNKKI
ncbi:unnamed protein product, partial [Rotaria sp. Silwood2]